MTPTTLDRVASNSSWEIISPRATAQHAIALLDPNLDGPQSGLSGQLRAGGRVLNGPTCSPVKGSSAIDDGRVGGENFPDLQGNSPIAIKALLDDGIFAWR